MKRLSLVSLAAILVGLLSSAPAFAQSVACVPTTGAHGAVIGRTLITFQSPDHAALDPAGAPKVADYFGEVRVKGQTAVATNFTVPKTSVSPVTGATVAGCLGSLLPAMSGLLGTNTYTLTFLARGPGGSTVSATTADFFLQGAPAAPANTALVTPGS